jgi:methane monooxygenase PmoA-like
MHTKVTTLFLILMVIALQPARAWSQTEEVRFTRRGNNIHVSIGGQPFTTYHFDPGTAKAYLQPLRNAHGVIVTRAFPVGDTIPPGQEHDPSLEPHQRPMYFGHGDIGGYDFWSEKVFAKYYSPEETAHTRWGQMVLRKIEEMRGGPRSGVIRASFDLRGDEKVLGEETQQFIFRGDPHSRVIDCEFVIRADHGALKIGDTKEGTFAIRVAPELDAPKGHMVNSEGGEGEPQIWGKRANWVDYDGVIDGQSLGIAIFDSPKSFRHPTTWHARGYGLFAANPFGLKQFMHDPAQDGSDTIPAGQTVRFIYRVLIHDGNYKDAGVAEKYKEYAGQP